MNKRRIAIAFMLTAAAGIALGWGLIAARAARGTILDFRIVYYGARCLAEGKDLYNEQALMQVYLAEGGTRAQDAPKGSRTQQVVAAQIYLPPAELVFLPFGMLPWRTAYLIWVVLTFVGLTTASFLVWEVASRHAYDAAFYLIVFLLVNSGVLLAGGNPAGVAISLCVISAWCFIQDRFVILAVVCLALSLAIKPHDTWLVWLYFFLSGRIYRNRALSTLVLTCVLSLIAVTWISQISPHWISELHSTLQAFTVPGSYVDPGPTANKSISPGMIISLQTITSVFSDHPAFYNPTAYLIFAPFLATWVFFTVRTQPSLKLTWLALAAIAPLTMLPAYHRPYDAKLLLLTIPACAMLWSERGVLGWSALALNVLGIGITSDLPLSLLSILTTNLQLPAGALRIPLTLLFLRPVPLVLLAMGCFYLIVYARSSRSLSQCTPSSDALHAESIPVP